MVQKSATIDIVAKLISQAAKKVLESSTQKKIINSPTIQSIAKVAMKPDVTCFVQFSGDYNGLVVMNFSAQAAINIYQNYMLTMGLPLEELATDFTSVEVADSLGEMTNQIMGNAMSLIEEKFELSAFCGQPKALALNSVITLIIDSDYRDNRRLSFRLDNHSFHIELAMEQTEFL